MRKQVEKLHYDFKRYVHMPRWASMWHQFDEVLKWNPVNVLEIGPGPGFFKAGCQVLGVPVETVDLDPELQPDHICSVLSLPFAAGSFDVVCAFQMLEHLPYEQSMEALAEMSRVGRKAVLISLPDAARAFPFSIYIPKVGPFKFFLKLPLLWPKKHVFDGEHYWEVNKKGFDLKRISLDIEKYSRGRLKRTFRVPEFPYHRFFIVAL